MLEKIKLLTRPYHLYLGFFVFLIEVAIMVKLFEFTLMFRNEPLGKEVGNIIILETLLPILNILTVCFIISGIYATYNKESSFSKKINLFLSYLLGIPVILISVFVFFTLLISLL